MAYVPHTLVAFGGTFATSIEGGDVEIWECGIRGVDPVGNVPLADTQTYMQTVAGPLATWFAQANHYQSQDATLSWLKVNNIGADGKYSDAGVVNVHDYIPLITGGAASVHPSIISACTSWRTAKGRGIGSHGRIYLPNFTVGRATDMTLNAGETQEIATAGKALLTTLMTPPGGIGPMFLPVIASKGSKASGYTDGVNTPITQVACGSVLDLQRRRKNALTELYSVASFP